MTNSLNLKFEENFKITTSALHFNRAHPDSPRNLPWMLYFSVYIGVFMACAYFLCYSIFVHHIKAEEYAEASKNGAMVVVAINMTYKYILIQIRQKDIKELIKLVDKDYSEYNSYSDEDKDIVQEYVNKGVFVCKLLFAGGFSTFISFPLEAGAFMIYYYIIGEFRLVQMFDIKLPEPMETYKNDISIVFWSFFVLTLLFDLFTATMYMGFDSLAPLFMLHVCGQIALLNQRIGRIFVEFDDPKQIERELKTVVIKMQSLYEFVERVKSYFSTLYECNMKTTIFLLPLIAFRITQDLSNIHKNPDFIFFFAGTFLHFFIPCYYSDLLMEQSANLRQAIYFSGWQTCTHKGVRQIILFMLTKAKIPMGIRTIFYEMNLDTFAEMCRQAYGIFNMLNAAH